MHEMSVSQSILDIALRHAEQAGAGRIVAIELVIGDLTGFVDESIQFYIDFLSKETLAQGAQLRFERIAPRVLCHACRAEYAPPDSRLWACPKCEALGGEILAGKEFYVASIEIEQTQMQTGQRFLPSAPNATCNRDETDGTGRLT